LLVSAEGGRKEDPGGRNELAEKNNETGFVTRTYIVRKEFGQIETLISRIIKRRLTWFGHVVRMEGKRLDY